MWRALTIFKTFLVTASGPHDPRRFKSPPAVCPCCYKVNGDTTQTSDPVYITALRRGIGFIMTKLDNGHDWETYLWMHKSSLCLLFIYLFANM